MAKVKAPEKRSLLIARLDTINTSGLGFSPLSGKTLVQFSGSLTGRDFRAISQVAPFVLYDLIPVHCYKAWLALCTLVPLVWQPIIYDIESHLVRA